MTEEQARMILGVGPDAGYEECKRGYHDAMRRWHTDVRGQGESSTRAAQQVNEAWEIVQTALRGSSPKPGGDGGSTPPPRNRAGEETGQQDPGKPTGAANRQRWAIGLVVAIAVVVVAGFGGRALFGTKSTGQPATPISDVEVANGAATAVVAATPQFNCSDADTMAADAARLLTRFRGKASDGSYSDLKATLRDYGTWFNECLRLDPTSEEMKRARDFVARADSAIPAEVPTTIVTLPCSQVEVTDDSYWFLNCQNGAFTSFQRVVYSDVPALRVARVNEYGRRLKLLVGKFR